MPPEALSPRQQRLQPSACWPRPRFLPQVFLQKGNKIQLGIRYPLWNTRYPNPMPGICNPISDIQYLISDCQDYYPKVSLDCSWSIVSSTRPAFCATTGGPNKLNEANFRSIAARENRTVLVLVNGLLIGSVPWYRMEAQGFLVSFFFLRWASCVPLLSFSN